MISDDHDDNDRRKSRGDTDKLTRDARGRWLPDHCPNPKGRPKKKPKVVLGESDIRIFGHTLVDVVASGQKEMMDRRSALLNKMFESAMKGSVSQQRFLYREFERNAERLAALRVRYERLMLDWYINNTGRLDMPFEVELEIEGLGSLLNHYFPGQYPLGGVSANDDSDDDDSDDGDG